MVVDLMLADLVKRLEKVNWSHKVDLYSPVFESVEFKNEILNPTISIIVISWQYNDQILQNFESLSKQRQTNFELIFVNNGKNDEEFKNILPYVDVYIKLNTNTGAYKARNIGAIFAQASILFFLEDDGVADEMLVQSHVEAFNLFYIISLRGVCKPLNKHNKLNKLAKHYYLGPRPFPRYVDLEGNASYKSEAFFAVDGWRDAIEFGHGGLELAIRLNKLYPNKSLQIYSPKPIIFHDYAKNEEHLKLKRIKQQKTLSLLKQEYLEWDSYKRDYRELVGKTHQLILLEHNAYLYKKFYLLYLIEKGKDFFLDPIIYLGVKIKHLLPQSVQKLIKDRI